MIKINELRIGNLVELDNEYLKVISLDSKNNVINLQNGKYYYDKEINGIPLTTELVANSEFNPWKDGDEISYHKDVWQTINGGARLDIDYRSDGKIYLKSRYDQENKQVQCLESIVYYHQLQNLYFFLSNHELTLWTPISTLPKVAKYYRIKLTDGRLEYKPFRIRPHKNIHGFMTLDEVTHWCEAPEGFDALEVD